MHLQNRPDTRTGQTSENIDNVYRNRKIRIPRLLDYIGMSNTLLKGQSQFDQIILWLLFTKEKSLLQAHLKLQCSGHSGSPASSAPSSTFPEAWRDERLSHSGMETRAKVRDGGGNIQ